MVFGGQWRRLLVSFVLFFLPPHTVEYWMTNQRLRLRSNAAVMKYRFGRDSSLARGVFFLLAKKKIRQRNVPSGDRRMFPSFHRIDSTVFESNRFNVRGWPFFLLIGDETPRPVLFFLGGGGAPYVKTIDGRRFRSFFFWSFVSYFGLR